MSNGVQFIPKRGGSLNGTYSDNGKIASFEIRDGKIISATSLSVQSLLQDISFSVHSPGGSLDVTNAATLELNDWTVTRYNTGSFSAGRFTAPIDGKYSFSIKTRVSCPSFIIPSGDISLNLRKLPLVGAPTLEAIDTSPALIDGGGSTSRPTASQLSINIDLFLEAGEIVYADIYNISSVTHSIAPGVETFFCGKLLH